MNLDSRTVGRLAVLALVVVALQAGAGPARAQQGVALNPMIFVHGYVGSGGQFESQKLRFVENGYPESYVQVLEYDSTPATPVPGATGLNPAGVQVIEQQLFPRLDALIAQLKAQTGRPKVDLLAHSLGTTLMQDYLNSSPARAATVAHYVNIDGRTASSPPGGVPTLALWATKGPLSPAGRSIGGATNVTIPDSTHVQSATSPISFAAMYRFFTGQAPGTIGITPESGPITLAGKALQFPNNAGLAGATVQVWPIDPATGQRTHTDPIATYQVGTSGDWGPVHVQAGGRYEFALLRPGAPVHHFYYEPFLRSDNLIRLLESDALRSAGGAPSTKSVGLVVLRYKELWGDQGAENDLLTMNGISVCTPTVCPLAHLVNALFAYDRGDDGKTDTSKPDPVYYQLPFVSGADVYLPAQNPPVGKVTVALRSRGGGAMHTIVFPNFPAATDVSTVQLNDFDLPAEGAAPGPAGSVPSSAGAPAPCVRRARFIVRLRARRRGRIVRADAYIDGRRVKHVRRRRIRRMVIRRPAGRDDFTVVIVTRAASGRRTVTARRFSRCTGGPVARSHRRHRRGR